MIHTVSMTVSPPPPKKSCSKTYTKENHQTIQTCRKWNIAENELHKARVRELISQSAPNGCTLIVVNLFGLFG